MAITFLVGGGSRDDIQSLIVLRPLAALFLAFSLATVQREHLKQNGGALALLGFLVLINVIQLVPLPPQVWTSLPGRSLVVEISEVLGIEQAWRPISMVPFRTWNSLFALMVPLSALLLVSQCDRDSDMRVILTMLVGIACFSAFLGLLQILAPADTGLYFYDITNRGLAVGLFANRNHNAAFVTLAIPIAAHLLRSDRRVQHSRPYKAVLIASLIALPPFVVLTGSRAGLLMLMLALASLPFLVTAGTLRAILSKKVILLPALAAMAMLTALAALSPAGIVRRMMEANFVEIRAQAWPIIWELCLRHFPVGTGLGTLPEVFRIAEPDAQIRESYLNHAHNDWLELFLETGAAGALLLLFASALWLRSLVVTLRRGAEAASRSRLGLVLLAMLAVASLFDYPLRTPSLALTLAIAAAMARPYTRTESRGSNAVA
jgi:O-antigen ligase